MRFAALVGLLALPTPILAGLDPQPMEQAGDNRMVPIEASPEANDPDFITQRCQSLLSALRIRRTILVHNPITGTNFELGQVFNWVLELPTYQNITEKMDMLDLKSEVFTSDYMDAFGAIHFPSQLPDMGLYIADKATCLDAFGDVR